ncbi:MAG: hypothetical protein QM754_06510 [Tepidisphaeraceae bacterium]
MLKRWVHVIVNTRCSWLHGDPRGFRDRGHRLHSSGDYKHRPPQGEHADVYAFYQNRSGEAVHFDLNVRIRILRSFVTKLMREHHRVIAASCGEEHLHSITELPASYEMAKKDVAKAKQAASHAVRDVLPGSVWAAGGAVKRVKDVAHFRATYQYVRRKQEAGTVVWSHRPEEDWIANPDVGAIVIRPGWAWERLKIETTFPGLRCAQTPASERSEDPGKPPKTQ